MDPAELEKRTHELLMHYDAMDFDAVKEMFSADTQGVDELSKKWLRGAKAIDEYFRMAGSMLSDIHSDISDPHVVMYGSDVGVITCMVRQSYKLEGKPATVMVPTSIVWVREDGDWKASLIHAVGLPED